MKKIALVALPLIALAACGDSGDTDGNVYGPEDYEHFSSYFTMNESTANEMTMDGGDGTTNSLARDKEAAILTAEAPDSSPAVTEIE